MQKGLRPRRSIRNAMAHEVMFYAIGTKRHLLNASYTDMPFQHY